MLEAGGRGMELNPPTREESLPPTVGRERRSLRNRTIAAIWAVVRTHGRDDAWIYTEASAEVGRLLQPGFGLSTCTDQELGRILVRVKRALGSPMNEYRQRTTDHRPRRRAPTVRADGEARVSSDQTRFERQLIEELHLSEAEVEGIFRRATGQYFTSRMSDHYKFVAALQSIKRRRVAAASRSEDIEQSSEVSGQRAGAGGQMEPEP